MSQVDLILIAGETSGDLQGAKLIEELLRLNPQLKISAVAGPKMRALPIHCIEPMESLQVMGFIDVFFALPKIISFFFSLRKKIFALQPKAIVTIDYPGFNLRLQKSLKKKGFSGKQIHYICPTVWAWGKKRIPMMAKTLDLLLTILPFEPKYFEKTSLRTLYVGHPLIESISRKTISREKLIALFPGSRSQEVERNLPLQLAAAKALQAEDPTLRIAISCANEARAAQIKAIAPDSELVEPNGAYSLMQKAHLAIAKSGTVTLELALHKTPTVVTFAIKPFDQFLATKIFKINLPFYALPNLILQKEVFPELFGSNLTLKNLLKETKSLCFDETKRDSCRVACVRLWEVLEPKMASQIAASQILLEA